MTTVTTTITEENQVALPAELLEELALQPGMQIEWSTTEDGALLGRRKFDRGELARRLMGRGRRFLKSGDDPIQELTDERVREDEEEGLA